MGILAYNKESGVFWIIIFGWSGIAATFCPVIILSLFWSRITALAARWGMVAGFLAVPFFKFAAPQLLERFGMSDGNKYLAALDVLFPSFIVSFAVAIIVSMFDRAGQAKLTGVREDLQRSKRDTNPD
jgi:Na+/proline symporter